MDHALRAHVGAGAFYVATAIPMSWVFFLLPALMREAGQSAQTVSLLSLVYLPYALRIAWAPAIDRFAAGNARRFQRLMILSLALAIAVISTFALVDPARDVFAIMALAGGLFVVLATGATALDGYTITTLDEAARARASIWQTAGFTIGGIVLGVGAFVAAGLNWTTVTLLIMAATAIAALPVLRMPATTRPVASIPGDGPGIPGGTLRDLLRLPEARRLILMSVLTKAGLGMVAGYLPILQVDSGVSASMAGFFGAIGSNVLGLLAALASGAFLLRFGGWRAIGSTCLIAAILFGLAALFHAQLAGPVFSVALSFVFLSLGYACIAPFKALSLAVSDGRMGASKAAMLASLDLTLSIIAAALSGTLVVALGLGGFFWLSMALCLAAALLAFRAVSPVGRSTLTHLQDERSVVS